MDYHIAQTGLAPSRNYVHRSSPGAREYTWPLYIRWDDIIAMWRDQSVSLSDEHGEFRVEATHSTMIDRSRIVSRLPRYWIRRLSPHNPIRCSSYRSCYFGRDVTSSSTTSRSCLYYSNYSSKSTTTTSCHGTIIRYNHSFWTQNIVYSRLRHCYHHHLRYTTLCFLVTVAPAPTAIAIFSFQMYIKRRATIVKR